MCGICGLATQGVVAEDAVRKMTDLLVHRGPDDEGFYIGEHAALGMRRLSIIDLPGGHQPVSDEAQRLHLVFNGEIYNHRELRERLQARGHRFRSRSDTEVIVHAYEDDGSRAFEALRGMFAIAIWDSERKELVLAVDRLGIKPLYVAASADRVVFASEVGALRGSRLCESPVDFDALGEYFEVGYIAAPRTAFLGMSKLPPGSYLRWSPGSPPEVAQFWQAPIASQSTTEGPHGATAPKELRRLLRDAVSTHLESDVPVGAFLSGGVDSSSVVALMREAGANRISTFSIGFEPEETSELPLARLVADRFSTDHHELVVRAEAAEVLPLLARHFGEPFGDSSALMTYYVAKMASDHVKVALSGDGGDELFLGYPLFLGVELARRLEVLPSPVRDVLRSALGKKPLRSLLPPRLNDRMTDSLAGVSAALQAKMQRPGLGAARPFLTREFGHAVSKADPFAACRHILSEESGRVVSQLEAVARTALRYSLPGDMLTKVDRTSMTSSLEVRVPLLDHRLAEVVSSIPVRERLPRWRLKALLKSAMSDVLPEEVLRGPKRGFQAPIGSWLPSLRSFARDVLLDEKAADRGYLDVAAVQSWLNGASPPPVREADLLWNLVMFELWCRDTDG